MNSQILLFYFISEILIGLIIFFKPKVDKVYLFTYFLFLIYAQSTYLKFLIFDISSFYFSYKKLSFDIDSDNFLLASSCYFVFLLVYGGLVLLKGNSLKPFNYDYKLLKIKNSFYYLVVLIIIFAIIYHFMSIEMTREQKKCSHWQNLILLFFT